MSYRYDDGGGYDPISRMMRSSVVKTLIFANFGIYILGLLSKISGHYGLYMQALALIPELVTTKLFVWQLVTAMFVHGNFLHIVFNMLVLFFFGPELEYVWGRVRFLSVYLGIGFIANLIAYLINIHSTDSVIGASGAVLGILAAYGTLYPNRTIIALIFPVKVKYLVIFYFILYFLSATGLEGGGGLADWIHLLGIVLGFAYVKIRWRPVEEFFRDQKNKMHLWYLRRKYRHLKIMDNFEVIDDRPEKPWEKYKQ